MKIKTQDYKNVAVVALKGDFDIEVTGLFQNTIMNIISNGKSGIVMDMSEVVFIDSDALEKLLWARDYCNENKSQFRLAGLDENCRKILEITRIENEFDSYIELSEAVKSFA